MSARITIIGTGGTIASATTPDHPAAMPILGVNDLVAMAGLSLQDVNTIDFSHEMSSALTMAQIEELAGEIDRQFRDGVEAIVVTQGTATIQETSYLLDLLLGDCPPVVCTGAMRPASDLSPDGPVNLRDALVFASASVRQRRGVYLVANGEIHAPIDVLKVNGASPAGFISPGVGVLGWVDAGEVRVRRERRSRTHRFPALEKHVELVTACLDASTVLLDAVVASDARGLVLGGFPGRATVPPSWIEPIRRYLASDRPLLFVSTSLIGRVLPKHGGVGSCRQLLEMGVIIGGDLMPVKARCLLSAILSESTDRQRIAELVEAELRCQ